uniref:Uncharacterized protein n=1 Tax=Aegilops tauschii subsp. strangulata TaxID=200361 RepID=A0A453LTV0_AEGTS
SLVQIVFSDQEKKGEMKGATASGGGATAGANDPRQPGTARPYAPPKLSSQDLPVDYAGFLAVVFGVVGVMLHVRTLDAQANKQSCLRARVLHQSSLSVGGSSWVIGSGRPSALVVDLYAPS